MSVDLRLPNIHGSDREQLVQMRSYLYQLVGELQWALNNTTPASESVVIQTKGGGTVLPSASSSTEIETTFGALKPLIIKSAEIVQAYYEEIDNLLKLSGEYVAASDFGTFKEETALQIKANSTSITQQYSNIQTITTDLGTITTNLGTVTNELGSVKNELGDLGGEVTSISGTVSTLGGEVSTISGNVSSLGDTVTTMDGKITTTNERIDEANQGIQGVRDGVAGVNNLVDATKEQLEGNLNILAGELGEIDSALQSTKGDLEGQIEGAKDELRGELQDVKDTTNSRIDDTIGMIDGVNGDLEKLGITIDDKIKAVDDKASETDKLLQAAKEELKGSLDALDVYAKDLGTIILETTAYIKTGLLYNTDAGIPVYGLEVGQEVEDGVTGDAVFRKYARFTSEKLSFYDSNDNEVAYISDKKLYIGQAEITVSFQIGKLMDLVMSNGDVVTKWVGG